MYSPPLSWKEYEMLAASHMRDIGFTDARVTPPGSDGGIDVVSTYAVAQVKAQAALVSRPQIQQLKGAATAMGRRALFYASSGFTEGAIQWANSADVSLFILNALGQATPIGQRSVNVSSGLVGPGIGVNRTAIQDHLAAIVERAIEMNRQSLEMAATIVREIQEDIRAFGLILDRLNVLFSNSPGITDYRTSTDRESDSHLVDLEVRVEPAFGTETLVSAIKDLQDKIKIMQQTEVDIGRFGTKVVRLGTLISLGDAFLNRTATKSEVDEYLAESMGFVDHDLVWIRSVHQIFHRTRQFIEIEWANYLESLDQ